MDGQNSKDDCNFPPTSRKRRYFNDDDCKDRDEDCAASAPKILIEEPPFCLLDFCDEILLEIFKNLDSNSLYSIGQTCHRLYRLIADHRLWKTIDLTSQELPQKTIRKRLKPMHPHTGSIAIKGLTGTFPKDSWNNVTMGNSLLRDITETCESLQVLELHHSFLNFEYMAITDFPRNIKRLVFNNCFVRWPKAPHAFFTRIDTHLGNLEELILEYCNWFETHDLVLFSKIPFLKKLSLRGCMNLKECVPYGSIATRFGFKNLEHLDVRDTLISDSDIQCFNITYTLKELLLECPDDIREMDTSNSREPRDPRDSRDPRDPRDPREPRNHGESPPPRPVRPILYAASSNNLPGNGEENNVVHIVIHDRSIINLRAPGRPIPNIEVNLEADPPQNNANENNVNNRAEQNGDGGVAVRQIPDINRAISQSLWFERRYPPPFSPPRIYPISDRGILCFGAPRNIAQANIIWIRAEPRPVDNNLERLTVRHYKLVTDTSLTHLALCSPKLVFLDLTGTAVTKAGVEEFKAKKPDCFVVSDHFTG